MKINSITVAVVYITFCGLVGFSVYYTESAACLWALLLFPGIKLVSIGTRSSKKKKKVLLLEYRDYLITQEKHGGNPASTQGAYYLARREFDKVFFPDKHEA